MWKYMDKEHTKEFILSLGLIQGNISDNKKLNLLYAISNHPEKYYSHKDILKRNGNKRELLIPNQTLKTIQRNILNHVLKGLSISKYATAYVKKRSLRDNAFVHVGKEVVLKLDIKNFFGNIHFEDLYRVLPNSLFPPSIKVLLLKLCTYEDCLPQGAPTSPYLSNLVMRHFDDYIGNYCEKKNISYTRYSDDLTFSGNMDVWELKKIVQSFLDAMGFSLNEEKTKILRKNIKQTVTGVVVNEKINSSKSYRRKIRQEMYYIQKYGLDNHNIYMNQNIMLSSLMGKVRYCLFLDSSNKEMKTYEKRLKSMI